MPLKHSHYIIGGLHTAQETVRTCPMQGTAPDYALAKTNFPNALIVDVTELPTTGIVTIIPTNHPPAARKVTLAASKIIAARIALMEGATLILPALPPTLPVPA